MTGMIRHCLSTRSTLARLPVHSHAVRAFTCQVYRDCLGVPGRK
jgi:hypothetical protein